MHKHLRNQLEQTRKQLVAIKNERENNRNKNMQFELEVIELTEIVNNLKENVDSQRHDNFLKLNKQRERQKMEEMENEMEEESINKTTDADDERQKKETYTKAKADKVQSKNDQFLNLMPVSDEFPPEVVIQQNLIRAQVEFYFSDYNLKRDKRLLEKICKEPKRGYLEVNEVLNLSRVRQLCNSPSNLYDALKSSPYIHMILSPEEEKRRKQELQQQQEEQTKQADDNTTADKADDDDNDNDDEDKDKAKDESTQYHPLYVGRKRFTPPTEKQFPFRRSVYIYGLPWYADEKYIYSMLNAFGGVTKVHFDHGPDTLDRQIMKKMLEKHRVYKLLSKDSAALTMEFNQMSTKQEVYNCYWCRKQKPCVDGYYHPKRLPGTAPSYRVCLQCAAAKAEEQSQKYDARSKLLKDDKRLRELLLGLPPRSIEQCKTALCVFASQRQASKCVYVRSRLAYDGAFATHYHHYSKLKKEIALSIKPKVRFIGDGSNKNKNKKAGDKDSSTANNNNNYAATLKANKVQRTQPNMLKIITAPVYEQEGTAVIQPHVKTAKSNKSNTDNDANADTTTTIADQQKQQNK